MQTHLKSCNLLCKCTLFGEDYHKRHFLTLMRTHSRGNLTKGKKVNKQTGLITLQLSASALFVSKTWSYKCTNSKLWISSLTQAVEDSRFLFGLTVQKKT